MALGVPYFTYFQTSFQRVWKTSFMWIQCKPSAKNRKQSKFYLIWPYLGSKETKNGLRGLYFSIVLRLVPLSLKTTFMWIQLKRFAKMEENLAFELILALFGIKKGPKIWPRSILYTHLKVPLINLWTKFMAPNLIPLKEMAKKKISILSHFESLKFYLKKIFF